MVRPGAAFSLRVADDRGKQMYNFALFYLTPPNHPTVGDDSGGDFELGRLDESAPPYLEPALHSHGRDDGRGDSGSRHW